MNKLKLSNRLLEVASYIPEGAYFADIGSDHAYLPCHVCLKDPTAKAIAGEINEGPFNSAQHTVDLYKLGQQIEVRLGNGLEVLKDKEVNHIVIAGMGGSLIKTILDEGKSKLSTVERIIAQPNVDARNVRRWFFENNFTLTKEVILEENDHIYEIIVAERNNGDSLYSDEHFEKELLFGPLLLKQKTSVFLKKWKLEHEKLGRAIAQMNNATAPDNVKMERFKKELAWMEEVLKDEWKSPE
ncbi:tRNA (adenine(22)-N(1))-methyltransferase [Oceanobacillus damuensis]|uniref:tRNA (adenine(22)-N(1))-methyltransferase n=1 Tax=Oceanobacillus damuensis TaxID=937928 RepID=UPI000B226FB4|nr:class I SAM-dependent methyltransferase [Oceanobacillus damuensis]